MVEDWAGPLRIPWLGINTNHGSHWVWRPERPTSADRQREAERERL